MKKFLLTPQIKTEVWTLAHLIYFQSTAVVYRSKFTKIKPKCAIVQKTYGPYYKINIKKFS